MEASNGDVSQGPVKSDLDATREEPSVPTPQNMEHEELFRDVGKQVDGLTLNGGTEADYDAEDAPKMVEEIESLCMNCEKNVRYSLG